MKLRLFNGSPHVQHAPYDTRRKGAVSFTGSYVTPEYVSVSTVRSRDFTLSTNSEMLPCETGQFHRAGILLYNVEYNNVQMLAKCQKSNMSEITARPLLIFSDFILSQHIYICVQTRGPNLSYLMLHPVRIAQN